MCEVHPVSSTNPAKIYRVVWLSYTLFTCELGFPGSFVDLYALLLLGQWREKIKTTGGGKKLLNNVFVCSSYREFFLVRKTEAVSPHGLLNRSFWENHLKAFV